MRICVCIKAIPRQVPRFDLNTVPGWVGHTDRSLTMNEPDDYALEEALAFAGRLGTGTEITVITVGPLPTMDILYQGLAKGASKAVRVNADFVSPTTVSRLLVGTLKHVGFDLIVTGIESRDNLAGSVAGSIAASLDLPLCCAATKMESGEQPESIRVTKEMGGGNYEVLELTLPAVIAVQTGTETLKYIPPKRLLEARRKPLTTLTPADLGVPAELEGVSRPQVLRVFPPPQEKEAEFLEGQPQELANIILDKILEVM